MNQYAATILVVGLVNLAIGGQVSRREVKKETMYILLSISAFISLMLMGVIYLSKSQNMSKAAEEAEKQKYYKTLGGLMLVPYLVWGLVSGWRGYKRGRINARTWA